MILNGTPKPTGKYSTTEWAETEESRRWGTITPIEDRATFHREIAPCMLEDASPENIRGIAATTAGSPCSASPFAPYSPFFLRCCGTLGEERFDVL